MVSILRDIQRMRKYGTKVANGVEMREGLLAAAGLVYCAVTWCVILQRGHGHSAGVCVSSACCYGWIGQKRKKFYIALQKTMLHYWHGAG